MCLLYLKFSDLLPETHTFFILVLGKLNSFLASSDFCHLLITFANNLDPDQDGQNVGPDLDPNFDTLIVFQKEILKKKIEKKSADDKTHENLQSMPLDSLYSNLLFVFVSLD